MSEDNFGDKINQLKSYNNVEGKTTEEQKSFISDSFETLTKCLEHYKSTEDKEVQIKCLNLLNECLRILRNGCAWGEIMQDFIVSLQNFFPCMMSLISMVSVENGLLYQSGDSFMSHEDVVRTAWQLLANLCVINPKTQNLVWKEMGDFLMKNLETFTLFNDLQIMMLYNLFQAGIIRSCEDKLFKLLVRVLDTSTKPQYRGIQFEFLHIFLEHFLTKYGRILSLYGPLPDAERLLMIHYIIEYIRQGSSAGPIPTSLLNYLSKEFKKKSDCVLKIDKSYVETIYPREVLALLELIAVATGTDMYDTVYANDHSLFLNVGGLLQSITDVGKNSNNIFTPMKKLGEIAPNANENIKYQKLISFELKSMLVRALANLSYKNRKNQDYAREMGVMLAIFECTIIDARNPLIREWSVLAIRNLCENNKENQDLIQRMIKVGDCPNDHLSELSFKLGSLRIRPTVQ